MEFDVPQLVRAHIYGIFSGVNDSVSTNMSLNPNMPEESLDISFIASLSTSAAPTVVSRGWAVKIAAHFIGSIRHHRRYEIADIGIVIVFKRRSLVVARKLLLLQSKRLYPNNYEVTELDDTDYELGLGMVTRGTPVESTIFSQVEFVFDQRSTYRALQAIARSATQYSSTSETRTFLFITCYTTLS